MKILKNEKGFTLIELVLIIVILGILGAVATVQFGTIITDAKNSAIDGTFGQYSAQLSLAINSLKAIPNSG
ncbi:MAG: type II secretion system protein, partial [Nitrospirae bacterium]|nr:type II secretion system protein [Nitrospirota bacterium]